MTTTANVRKAANEEAVAKRIETEKEIVINIGAKETVQEVRITRDIAPDREEKGDRRTDGRRIANLDRRMVSDRDPRIGVQGRIAAQGLIVGDVQDRAVAADVPAPVPTPVPIPIGVPPITDTGVPAPVPVRDTAAWAVTTAESTSSCQEGAGLIAVVGGVGAELHIRTIV